jgi:hypothetical protein
MGDVRKTLAADEEWKKMKLRAKKSANVTQFRFSRSRHAIGRRI